ncbi:MAG: glucans biosynthesis glucosyltransferase MdoH [Steroidobacteraceae bacterium]
MDGGLTTRQPGPMPPAAGLRMPIQDLRVPSSWRRVSRFEGRAFVARLILWIGTFALTGYGVREMLAIISVNDDPTVLQRLMVIFFGLTLAWISHAAASAVAGLLPARRVPLNADPETPTRTALVMPIYNEDASRTTAGLRAMAEALAEQGDASGFEIVILSDSTQPDAWMLETQAVARLRDELCDIMPVWYRRRWRNTGRKVGNLHDFVEHWGGRYDFMITLDADSLMGAGTLIRLRQAMQADAELGLLQTLPRLVGRRSLYARLQQFGSCMYGPPAARGVAAWSGNEGNYWGHNAIVRIEAFAGACGLPELPGRGPFGGHILSHDFVEAALLRRAGWKVRMVCAWDGSYEESPPSLIDLAIRDRRWAQGNLQHSKVLGAAGLSLHSRLHFVLGIFSYLSSPLWLILLLLGLALSVQAGLHQPQYFDYDFQLFPNWPLFDSQRMLSLFGFSIAVLFVPKTLGALAALFSRRVLGAVGFFELVASILFELFLAALYAPVQMLLQSRHVIEILTGRDAGWQTQRRSEGTVTWSEAWRFHRGHTLAGLVMGALFAILAPELLWWLSPVLAGLILSVPLSRVSGSAQVGRMLARVGLLLTPEEVRPPPVVARRDALLRVSPKPPADGLRWLAGDPAARSRHLSGNLAPPSAPAGEPDADHLTASQKLSDAQNLDQALGWLTSAERIWAAADPLLLHRLAALHDAAAEEAQPRMQRPGTSTHPYGVNRFAEHTT